MTWWAFAAAASTVLAVTLARPGGGWVVRLRLGLGSPSWSPHPPTGVLARVAVVAVVVVAIAASRVSVAIVAGTAMGATLFGWHQARQSRARAEAGRTRAQTVVALELLAAELRAGILPGEALAALADDIELLRPAAAATVSGGDVVSALRAAGTRPGAAALGDLAGAWHVAERAGAPLADVLDRVATAVRDDAELDRDVRAEAAPARATGRLMAVLPLLGLSLGAGMGADPVHVLTGTVGGSLCLAGGVALAAGGIAWVDRIVASVDVP
jgi:tight adherence protein B